MESAVAAQHVERNLLAVSGKFDPSAGLTELRLEDGRILLVATEALLQKTAPSERARASHTVADASVDAETVIVPVVEERLEIGRRVVATGAVRLEKSVQDYEIQLDELLAMRTYEVERIARNEVVDSIPGVRHEGQTTVYPVIEEQLVLTKQLVLVEELRVTERNSTGRDTRPITLRREHVTISREQADTT